MRDQMREFVHIVLLVSALALSFVAAYVFAPEANPENNAESSLVLTHDADGYALPIGQEFERIISLSLVGTGILQELGMREQVVAVSKASANPLDQWMFGLPRLAWNADTPAILEHRPDLVIMGGYDGSAAVAARLREQGIAVIGLGQATGMMSYRQNRRRLARVFGQEATTELRIAREDITIASIQSWVQAAGAS